MALSPVEFRTKKETFLAEPMRPPYRLLEVAVESTGTLDILLRNTSRMHEAFVITFVRWSPGCPSSSTPLVVRPRSRTTLRISFSEALRDPEIYDVYISTAGRPQQHVAVIKRQEWKDGARTPGSTVDDLGAAYALCSLKRPRTRQ
eukprot:tig00021339_g20381.t1